MQILLISIFFFLIFILFYTFFGYPLLLCLLSLFKKPVSEPPIPDPLPFVSIVIPAYNEASGIKKSIENILNIDYPPDKFELIIVSDASSDGTDDIVSGFHDKRVKLVRLSERGGASKAIDAGIRASSSEYIVTSDANPKMDKDMVRYLIRHFQDKNIGGISGDKIVRSLTGEGESVYWKYENAIKNLEYKAFGTVLSSDNVNFALRKSIFTDYCPPIIGHDFWLSLYIASKGYKVAYEKKAKVYEELTIELKDDAKRKARVILGGLQALFIFPYLLFSFRNFGASVQLISHKLLRWLACIFMVLLFALNFLLIKIALFRFLLLCQLLFYGIATTGWALPSLTKNKAVKIVTYFTAVNAASLPALFNYFIKNKKTSPLWDKARQQ